MEKWPDIIENHFENALQTDEDERKETEWTWARWESRRMQEVVVSSHSGHLTRLTDIPAELMLFC